ncbi:tRNA-splicing endonuclease subunit Sen2-1 [Camellia lanceoleosa]|uniref:tRNA-splicing endonuclease subunit Sen2-1 n=1 Tax=Camellia lanceoleosa TaxID=1840588 RepID=A0ACC0HR27_9ERIC|nr:tRNA-splicing endonuclease subunit Sen2-1 [Camellia lanceoleosa]
MDYSQDAVLLEEETVQTELFNRACFGRPVVTAHNENHWFHLNMEEVFYLCYYLRCLKIVCKDELLHIDTNSVGEERVITRWNAEQSRENKAVVQNGTK